jgi:fructose-specific component phosphotransferase system IIB-like protein
MNRLLVSTALALALGVSTGALAQTSTAPAPAAAAVVTQQQAGEYLAEDVIGATVRNAQNENIGSVTDLVIDSGGQVKAAIVSVGGFLGIGDKHVAVPWTEMRLTAARSGTATGTGGAASGAAEASRDPAVMVNMTKDQLKQAPEFKTMSQQQREMDRSRTVPSGTAPAPRTTPVQ